MDAYLRGTVEEQIDKVISQNTLGDAYEIFKKTFYPIAKNIEDTLFGYVIGRTMEFAFFYIWARHRRLPTPDEFAAIDQILKRRAIEIKSKITLVTNK